jgi:hypothetical protein
MELSFEIDDRAHLICMLSDGGVEALVAAADGAAAADALLGAADSALGEDGYGECEWLVPGGEYRWMLKRDAARLTVAVMWSSGTVTGYQHVFRSECDSSWFAARVREESYRIAALPPRAGSR